MLACGLATHFVSSDVYYLYLQHVMPIYNYRKSIRFPLLICVNWSICYRNGNTDVAPFTCKN
uniref:Putative ovule protein n=1 Tax=Solanum chacoense TaxID=4108 RepID=A0A0V0HFG1_SOLCH